MPRTWPEILQIEQNQLASDHPFAFLAQLDYGAGTERITNQPGGVTFHGLLFAGDVPLRVTQFTEQGLNERPSLTIVVGNAARNVSALCEQHWVTSLDPIWTVTLWYVDVTQPDVLPFDFNVGVYEVREIVTDYTDAVFDLYVPSISTTRSEPGLIVAPPLFPNARVRS